MMKKLLLCALILSGCSKSVVEPVYVEYYKVSQMLLPSPLCPDTLIVRNAIDLNKGMGYYEQGFIEMSDYQLDSLLHTNCTIK